MIASTDIHAAGAHVSGLGESPLWDAQTRSLYYVDIPRRELLRLVPGEGDAAPALLRWALDGEPGCIALRESGGLLIAQRNGLWAFDPVLGRVTEQLLAPPYDATKQRFNDGKADPAGRWWIGGIDDARLPAAAFYRIDANGCRTMIEGISTGNGLAFSPDGRRLYWSDTKAHEIHVRDYCPETGEPGADRILQRFELRAPESPLNAYGGRPDGAAMDVEGCLWVAMFEGQRLLRLSPEGELLQAVPLPVRCPTMPAFGGTDLRTLYITTASDKRPEHELQAQPWAGCVLQLRVDVPGLPVPRVRL